MNTSDPRDETWPSPNYGFVMPADNYTEGRTIEWATEGDLIATVVFETGGERIEPTPSIPTPLGPLVLWSAPGRGDLNTFATGLLDACDVGVIVTGPAVATGVTAVGDPATLGRNHQMAMLIASRSHVLNAYREALVDAARHRNVDRVDSILARIAEFDEFRAEFLRLLLKRSGLAS